MNKKEILKKSMQEAADLQAQIDRLKAQQKTVVHECTSQFSAEELTEQLAQCESVLTEYDAKIAEAQAVVARLKAERKQKESWVKGRRAVLGLKAGHMSRVKNSHVYEHETGRLTFQRGNVCIEIDTNVSNWHNGTLKAQLEQNGITDGTQRGIIHRLKNFVAEQKALASA